MDPMKYRAHLTLHGEAQDDVVVSKATQAKHNSIQLTLTTLNGQQQQQCQPDEDVSLLSNDIQ